MIICTTLRPLVYITTTMHHASRRSTLTALLGDGSCDDHLFHCGANCRMKRGIDLSRRDPWWRPYVSIFGAEKQTRGRRSSVIGARPACQYGSRGVRDSYIHFIFFCHTWAHCGNCRQYFLWALKKHLTDLATPLLLLGNWCCILLRSSVRCNIFLEGLG